MLSLEFLDKKLRFGILGTVTYLDHNFPDPGIFFNLSRLSEANFLALPSLSTNFFSPLDISLLNKCESLLVGSICEKIVLLLLISIKLFFVVIG